VVCHHEHFERNVGLISEGVLVRSGIANTGHGSGEHEPVARLLITLRHAPQVAQPKHWTIKIEHVQHQVLPVASRLAGTPLDGVGQELERLFDGPGMVAIPIESPTDRV
jgi:hypothetical protein